MDQCVAQGVPFARDYAGYLDNRSFGGAQVSRTFYARGQTGQQLLLGAYSALSRQIKNKTVTMHPRTEMLDLVLVDGVARGITVRNLMTGEIDRDTEITVARILPGFGLLAGGAQYPLPDRQHQSRLFGNRYKNTG